MTQPRTVCLQSRLAARLLCGIASCVCLTFRLPLVYCCVPQAVAIAKMSHLEYDVESPEFEQVVEDLNAVLASARTIQVRPHPPVGLRVV